MITSYDPEKAPDSESWLALDESEKHILVSKYHEQEENMDVDDSQGRVHCMIQATVETQVAMGDETPVAEAINRLMNQGLDRHQALHAVASILIKHISNIWNTQGNAGGNEAYFNEVRNLSAQKWYDQFS